MTDVAVVGFGPTGAVASALLAQAGFSVTVIERTAAIYDKPRAIAIDHEILRLLDGLGLAEAVLPHAAPFAASEHFGAEGQLIRRIEMVPEPYPQSFTPTMVFSQPPVEAILRAHVAALPGVEVRLGCTVTGIRADGRLETTAGPVTAGQVIACDGAASFCRQALGLVLDDLAFDEPWLVVDLLLRDGGGARLPRHAAQFCDPARPVTYIIGPGAHRRFEIMLRPGEDPVAMQAGVWALLERWIGPDEAVLWRSAAYRFHALVARDWRRGRVFLAGDAAHQQPPFIGQGMCQGLRDVANLVWKLAAVRDGAAPALLESYGAERGAHVRALTGRIMAIGRQICETDPAAAAARDAALLAQGGGQAPVVTRQEIVPPLEVGFLDPVPHPARGTLFPQPMIATPEGWRRMDRVTGGGWRVVAMDDDASVPPGFAFCRLGPAALLERDGILAAWFARHGARFAVIRPDNYVYGLASDAPGLQRLCDAIEAVLRPTTNNA